MNTGQMLLVVGAFLLLSTLTLNIKRILLNRDPFEMREAAAPYIELKELLDDLDRNQIDRIRNSLSKTRLSILFYGINNACLKISEQTLQLLTIFGETFPSGKKSSE